MLNEKIFSSDYPEQKQFSQFNNHSSGGKGLGVVDGSMERGIDLNEQLIGNKPATFFVRVSSDAMKEAGIFKGDVAIVDRSLKASNGRVVIAVLDGEKVIRRFEKEKNTFRLVTDSNKLSPINIDGSWEGFTIWGVVTYVIHKP